MTAISSVTLTSPSGSVATLFPTFQGQLTLDGAPGTGQFFSLRVDIRRQSDDAQVSEINTAPEEWPSPFSAGPLTYSVSSATPLPNDIPLKATVTFSSGTLGSAGSTPITFTPSVNTVPTASLASPVAGAIVGTLTPTLTLNFTDPDSGTKGTFSGYQIQVRRVSDSVSFWDSGQLATTAGEKSARQVAKVYAGTTLVNGTAYQWRARVQDGAGAWSNYTSYANFTPNTVPDAPTGIAPSGLINTLTPTISGTYQQGSGGTEDFFQYEIRQNAVTIYSSGDVAADIATGQAYGTDNSGDTPSSPPALAWGTSYQVRARSKDNVGVYGAWSAWVDFHTNSAPTTPTNLSPNNGAVTGDTTPTLSWTHNDPDGDAQTAVEIELYDLTADAFVSGYDPKALSQATTTHDVATTLDQPHDFHWRIRTKGLAAAGFGPWSDWATFTDATGPSLTVDEPDPGDVITNSAFNVAWTFSGGSGTQASFRVKVYASDQTTLLYDSGTQAGTDDNWDVPAGKVHNGESDYVQVTVTDSLAQSAVSSLVPFSVAFTGPDAITGLTLTVLGDQS
jgi:hypothetical protein